MKPLILWRDGYWKVAYSGKFKKLSLEERKLLYQANTFAAKLNSEVFYSNMRDMHKQRKHDQLKQLAENLDKRRQERQEAVY